MTDVGSQLRPEFDLLLAVARRSCDDATVARLRSAARAVHWPLLLAAAVRHRMTVPLATHLERYVPELVPADVRAEWAQSRQLVAARALGNARETARLVEHLVAAGIPSLVYKGPALSFLALGELGWRPSVDLDLVVLPRDRQEALRVVEAAGYALADGRSHAEAATLYAGAGQWPMRRDEDGERWALDLHWRFASVRVPWTLPVEEVMARRQRVVAGGLAFEAPAPADALLLHLLRAARHGFETIDALMIVRELLLQHPIDGTELLARATAIGGRRAVLVGCRLAERLAEAPLPDSIVSAATADDSVDRLAGRVVAALESTVCAPERTVPERSLILELLERRGDRWRYRMTTLVLPTPREAEWIPLPAGLTWGYWLVRPLRLLVVRIRR